MEHSLTFRPLDRTDFSLLQRWICEPHVMAWWRDHLDLRGLEEKYGRRIDGLEPTHVFVIEYDEQPIGWIQWYRWENYPDHAEQLGAPGNSAGIDLALGEPKWIGQGLGPRIIRQFLSQLVFADTTLRFIMVDVEVGNIRSMKAFRKAGFFELKKVGLKMESFERCVMQTERPA